MAAHAVGSIKGQGGLAVHSHSEIKMAGPGAHSPRRDGKREVATRSNWVSSNNTDCLSCIRGTDMRSGTELYNTKYGRAGWSQIGGKIGKIQR